jgi:hypothetical protein
MPDPDPMTREVIEFSSATPGPLRATPFIDFGTADYITATSVGAAPIILWSPPPSTGG